MRISELITVEKTNQFKAGDIITIDAQMGKGKSYWVKNILHAIAKRDNKKILFLVHRKTCLDQFYLELKEDKKLDIIDIKTYQSIDSTMKYQFKHDFNGYDIIVCDEMHYFFNDSWNKLSDLSLKSILDAKDKIRIFMSATGDKTKYYIKNYLNLETINYYIPRDFSFIHHLEFYIKPETIHKYIRQILKTGEKAIVFIKSAQKAYDLHKMYDDSLFLCGESHELNKFIDKDKYKQILKDKKFTEQILFTTLTLEAGVDIIDTSLKNIIIDIGFNIDSMLQAFGRKRIEEKGDYIKLYLRGITNKQLGGIKRQLKEEYQFAIDFTFTNSDKKFVKRHYREQYRDLIYDEPTEKGIEKRLNITRFVTIQQDLEKIDEILEINNKNLSYCKYVSDLLGVDYIVSEIEVQMSDLEIYLNSIAGNELYKNERLELIQKVGLKDKKYRLQKGLNQLNAYFEVNEIPYRLISERNLKRKDGNGEDNPNFMTTYWKVLS